MGSKGFLTAVAVGLVFAPSPARSAEKEPNADLARQIKKAVLGKIPRPYEDLSQWGKTILPPPAVRFPRLRRTFVKVGDHYELPNGTWKRTRVWMPDPDRDLRIEVPSVRKGDGDTTRVRVVATAALQASRERRDWVNGVLLLRVTADADAVVRVTLDVDATIHFDPLRPLEGVQVGAKVTKVRLDLLDFRLRRVGPVMIREQGPLGEELKAGIQDKMDELTPKVKEYANRMIAAGLKGQKGLFPPAPGK